MSKYRLTKDADQDLIDIYLEGLVDYGLKQAEHYQDILFEKMKHLADNPSFGADYRHVLAGVRRAESVAHSIYYRETSDGILIQRILYKRMDPARHLS